MNGVHDLGGMDGMGPVNPPPEEPVFYTEWERRVFAMFVPALSSGVNLDQFRYGIESINPVDYLAGRYYEHWLHSFVDGLVKKGIIDAKELEQRTNFYRDNPDAPLPERAGDPEQIEAYLDVYRNGASTRRDSEVTPSFAAGDHVRVRNLNPSAHTRCARYVRGKSGIVAEVHGAFVFPDTNAKDEGENPQPVYNVRFAATELWGPEANGAGPEAVHFDLWQPYLEAA